MQTRFIGRVSDLARVASLWARGERLITIWGPGGMGKTRLALECARPWSQPSWFCDLSGATDQDSLCSVVAGALGVSPARRRAVEQIERALEHKGPSLLVLDNFEQLVDCAPVVLAWLRGAPQLSVLVTSRQRLRLPGEISHELLPLGVSGEEEAVQLFVACAQAVAPRFEAHGPQREQVRELVSRLEGIPLAIELAASRVDILGLGGLIQRLPTGLDLLGGARRGVERRQLSFREAVAWSWGLLSESEQRALAQCSVFSGGFTLADAEATLDIGEDVLSALEALRDKSMLRSVPGDEGARLSMYESLRSFAREQLDKSGERPAAEQRHAAYFLSQCEISNQPDRINPSDRANLVAVLRHLLGQEGPPTAQARPASEAPRGPTTQSEAQERQHSILRLMLVVEPLLATQGPFKEHSELLDRALAACSDPSLPPSSLARLQAARARARASQGDWPGAHEDLTRALQLARAGDDPVVLASVQIDEGVQQHQRRELPEAERSYRAALAALAGTPEGPTHARALGNLGALLHDAGQPEQARAAYEQALVAFRRHDDLRLEGIFVANLALLEQESGQLDEARRHLERAISRLDRAKDTRLLGITLGNLGALLHEQGEAEQACAQFQRAIEALRQVGDLRSEALALARLGAAEATIGLPDAAEASLDRAESLLGRLEDRIALRGLLVYRAFVALARAESLSSAAFAANSAPASSRVPASSPAPSSSSATAALARAQDLLRAVTEPSGGEPAPSEVLDDVRTALRILRPRLAAALAALSAPAAPPLPALLIGPEASWFQAPGADPQDLRLRRPLRAIVELLARHREEGSPGADLLALQEAGWPGEKMSPEAGVNRVRVALAELRKRGLRPCLLREGERFLLDPAIPLLRSPRVWQE